MYSHGDGDGLRALLKPGAPSRPAPSPLALSLPALIPSRHDQQEAKIEALEIVEIPKRNAFWREVVRPIKSDGYEN